MARWTLELPDQEWLRTNDREHWTKRARCAAAWRNTTAWAAAYDGLPRPIDGRVDITLQMVPPDRRRRDPDSLSLTLKHCVDGLVDAGVIPDDSDKFVRRTTTELLPPDGTGRRRWYLTVEIV